MAREADGHRVTRPEETGSSIDEHELAQALASRLARALDDAEARSARLGLDDRIAIGVGGASLGIVPEGEGHRVVCPAPRAASVRVSASTATWTMALAPAPPPGFHSITALRRCGRLSVKGDPAAFARSLHLLERLLELVRGPTSPPAAPAAERDPGQIEGRYHALSFAGQRATVFAERAGTGAPVVFLHTAGADGRQFHTLLADVALAQRWQLWAFDLPLHGRSMPTPRWNGGREPLTQALYQSCCAAFLEQVVREPAFLVGCSMGAAMALVLASVRPELLRGVVAIGAPYRARGRLNPHLAHPAVNSAAHNPSYVRGLMSPFASEPARRAAAWIYGQAGLGVYAGDLAFYEEFDGAAVAPRIDATRTPVELLAGAYDYSATPEDAARLAAAIPGASLQVMPHLGHFPMIEHPDLFRSYLVASLERLARTAGVYG